MYAMYCKQFAIVAYPYDGISFHIIKYSTSFLYISPQFILVLTFLKLSSSPKFKKFKP